VVIREMLELSPLVFVAAATGKTGDAQLAAHSAYRARRVKLVGLDADVLGALVRRLPGTTWLVEADGARGRLLKAPASHEPVIPPSAARIVIVACLDAVGRTLTEDTVHRPELAAALLDVVPGTTVTWEHIADLVAHPAGGMKRIPSQARVAVALTQWRDGACPAAKSVAERLLAEPRIDRVVWVNLADAPRVCQVWTSDRVR
jgi:molybdenum cofactor cytidylyltransferase